MLFILLLVWLLNLAISIFNANQVGKAWVESKHAGGVRRFMAWVGAGMAAVGFTWCIMVVLGLIAGSAGWLDAEHLELYFNTSYVLLVPPFLFLGYAIMINSWANAYRQRTKASYAIAAYNTFANAYNTYNAVTTFGDAMGKTFEGFFKNSFKNKDTAQLMLIVLLIAISFGGGIILTAWIINRQAARDEPLPLRPEPASSRY
jgi:hypothetical protein